MGSGLAVIGVNHCLISLLFLLFLLVFKATEFPAQRATHYGVSCKFCSRWCFCDDWCGRWCGVLSDKFSSALTFRNRLVNMKKVKIKSG